MEKGYHHTTHKAISIFASIFAVFALLACNEEQQWLPTPESATLKLTIGTPQTSIATRGISESPEDITSWSEDELLMDGRILQELALLVVDENDKLVAKKDFTYTNDIANNNLTVQQEATFKGLVAGKDYRLVAIANYTNLPDDFPELSVGDDISPLYNYTLDVGNDFVAPKQMQPLTWMEDITMPTAGGTHQVSGELVRTYARLRIEVTNKSDVYALTVNGLTFKTPFAQQKAYLLTLPGNPDRNFNDFTTLKGKPDITSEEAIISYDNDASGITIPKGNSTALFDAYILESRNGSSGYSYTLDVEYKTLQDVAIKTIKKSETVYTDATSLVNAYDENTMFLIESECYRNYYINADPDNEKKVRLENKVIDLNTDLSEEKHLLWKLKRYDNYNTYYYYLYNVGENVWIGSRNEDNPGQNSFSLTNEASVYFRVADFYYIDETPHKGIQLDQKGWGGTGSLYHLNAHPDKFICAYKKNDQGSGFLFYPVPQTSGGAKYDITLQTIDAVSGTASVATQIARNDFIYIYINVAYNEKEGTMDFYVADWEEVTGDITFN